MERIKLHIFVGSNCMLAYFVGGKMWSEAGQLLVFIF